MKPLLTRISIRTRLLVVYICIIVLGFAILTLTAGRQLSSAAASDYQQQLLRTVQLVAQGLYPTFENYERGEIEAQAVTARLDEFAAEVGANLQLYVVGAERDGPFNVRSFRGAPELESAIRGSIILVQRTEEGTPYYFTAAKISLERRSEAVVQLWVPTSHIQTVIIQRWAVLGAIALGVAAVAALAALWVGRSIIQPLHQLQTSAAQLARGDLAHRVVYIGQDEIGEVAKAFNHMAQQVENMVEEQRAFASNTSHELRTPLTTIRLRTEALRDDETLDEATTRHYIAEIDDEVIRLAHLVQDLTLLSRFDANRAEVGNAEVDMHRFASSLLQLLTPLAREKQIALTLETPESPLVVRAGLNHLTVLFRNLLENALKYTPGGGSVRWHLHAERDGVQSTITDTGRGIAAEDLPHLFERFYRVDRAHSREVTGTGLGLALAKSIVEAYHGTIAITSAGVEQGTIVEVWLPGIVE